MLSSPLLYVDSEWLGMKREPWDGPEVEPRAAHVVGVCGREAEVADHGEQEVEDLGSPEHLACNSESEIYY